MTKLTFNRRRFFGTVAMSGLALASPAYLRRANAAGGEVNIWTYNEFVPKAFKEQFETETGIKVNVRLVDDQGKQFNLLAAEAPNPTVDIMTVAGHRFLQFIDNDLLAPLDTGRLSNWGNINPTFSESDWSTINDYKWGAPILSGMEVLSYNTDLVSAEEARSWDILFSEKYKKKTGKCHWRRLSSAVQCSYSTSMVSHERETESSVVWISSHDWSHVVLKNPKIKSLLHYSVALDVKNAGMEDTKMNNELQVTHHIQATASNHVTVHAKDYRKKEKLSESTKQQWWRHENAQEKINQHIAAIKKKSRTDLNLPMEAKWVVDKKIAKEKNIVDQMF